MQRLLDGEQAAIKNRVREIISQPSFRYYAGTDKEGLREKVMAGRRKSPVKASANLFLPKSVGGEDDIEAFMAAFETLGFHDISLVIKFGVQFGLWGGSVLRLGTDYHHQQIPARDGHGGIARLLRHDRNRPRLQRARHRNRGHL